MKALSRYLIIIACTFALCTLAQQYIARPVIAHGKSMYPTVEEGDILVSLAFPQPQRDDVVLVNTGDGYIIKRLVGLPGDYICMDGEYVSINGKTDTRFPTDDPGCLENGLSLGDGEYLILGDNRQHSYDSRWAGVIGRGNIIGVLQV